MGPGILPETTVGKHNPPCQLKLYHEKRKPYVNMVKKRRRVLWAKAHLKWTVSNGKVFYGQTSPNLTFLLEITDAVSSGLKRRETFQRVISVQFKSQHLWWYGVHKCIRYGQLACFGRHYESWKVYKCFRATYAPLQKTCISAGQCKPYTAAITTAWLRSRRVLNWPAVQIFHL